MLRKHSLLPTHSMFHPKYPKNKIHETLLDKTLITKKNKHLIVAQAELVLNHLIACRLLERIGIMTSDKYTYIDDETRVHDFNSLVKLWHKKLELNPQNATALIQTVYLSTEEPLPSYAELRDCYQNWLNYLLTNNKECFTAFLKKSKKTITDLQEEKASVDDVNAFDMAWKQLNISDLLTSIKTCNAYELFDYILMKHPELINHELPFLVRDPHLVGTPLSIAVQSADVSMVELLIRHNVDVNQHELYTAKEREQSHSSIPLLLAIYNIYLINHKHDQDKTHEIEKYAKIIDILLLNGADPDLRSKIGLGTARSFSQEYLKDAPENVKPIFQKIIDSHNISVGLRF